MPALPSAAEFQPCMQQAARLTSALNARLQALVALVQAAPQARLPARLCPLRHCCWQACLLLHSAAESQSCMQQTAWLISALAEVADYAEVTSTFDRLLKD